MPISCKQSLRWINSQYWVPPLGIKVWLMILLFNLLSIPEWEEALEAPSLVYFNVSGRFSQILILHQVFNTSTHIHKAKIWPDDHCTKCQILVQIFFHLVWTCPTIATHWTEVCEVLTRITNLQGWTGLAGHWGKKTVAPGSDLFPRSAAPLRNN